MCGIVGIVNGVGGEPVNRALLERMTKRLAHRGPDDEGFFLEGPVGLGHRRLSIVDLSPSGHQPMTNEDGNLWIVFNGEIYNHRRLRRWLEAQGHRYRSQSDTETILHLYEERGDACVAELEGEFAFAIWAALNARLSCRSCDSEARQGKGFSMR